MRVNTHLDKRFLIRLQEYIKILSLQFDFQPVKNAVRISSC